MSAKWGEGQTGQYFENSKAKQAAKVAFDVVAKERLWAISEEKVGISAKAGRAA